ncbi:MAG TPA: GyrI-like domain-containing protein [Methanomassiliicoccales archaeon]|jgi:AraC family transcriptional regulator
MNKAKCSALRCSEQHFHCGPGKIINSRSTYFLGDEMTKPKLEERKETDLAYIEYTGRYDSVPWDEFMPRLYGWAKEQRVMSGLHPMGIYFDNPERVPPENCRSEIGITFKGPGKEAGGIKVRHMPVQKVASLSFKGPGSEYRMAYQELERWIDDQGLRGSGPCLEIFSKKPEMIDGVMILYSKILMPVESK